MRNFKVWPQEVNPGTPVPVPYPDLPANHIQVTPEGASLGAIVYVGNEGVPSKTIRRQHKLKKAGRT